jgi:Fe-S cluster assembly ATP-binding protein
MTKDALLSIQDLTASAENNEILRGVNLDVPQGEIHVLMGPNGAGKSTLGHVVMGNPLYGVTGGRILFDGEDITNLEPDKRSLKGLFLSFQAPVEIPGVPLASFLRAIVSGREGMEMKNKEFRNRVRELSSELNLDREYLRRDLGVGFSGGEKKKVEMLQLLLLQPKLAIMDETDSGLDVDALNVVSQGMESYHQGGKGTLLIITHNTRILERLSVDCVHVMVDGKLVAEGQADLIASIDKHGFEQFGGFDKPSRLDV